jgi:hypothetical protein
MNFQIIKLNANEIETLLRAPRFNSLHPVNCVHCKSLGPFERQIFRVKGVPKSRQSDEATQGLLAYHFREIHRIEYVFFKTNEKRYYVDSAVCIKCGSTQIVFDIDFTDDFLSFMAEKSGLSIHEVRKKLEELTQGMKSRDESTRS